MPRFHFTIRYLSVSEGIGQLDLPNLAAAHYEALKIAKRIEPKWRQSVSTKIKRR